MVALQEFQAQCLHLFSGRVRVTQRFVLQGVKNIEKNDGGTLYSGRLRQRFVLEELSPIGVRLYL